MKLIALKGVLEHQIKVENETAQDICGLSADSRRVMELMDSLL